MKIPITIGILALLVVVGIGMYVTDFTAYLGNNPTTCNNCHVMDAAYESWYHGGHKLWAYCGECHTDVAYVTERVATIQSQVRATMNAAEDAIVAVIIAIEAAAKETDVDTDTLMEARNLHREAQLRWDFINAENSMGFHNPEEALHILSIATDLARQAQLKAVLATGTPIILGASSQ